MHQGFKNIQIILIMRASTCFTCNMIFHLRSLLGAFSGEWHSSENSSTLIGDIGELSSVELRLLKARLCVIWHWSDNKTTTQKQLEAMNFQSCF